MSSFQCSTNYIDRSKSFCNDLPLTTLTAIAIQGAYKLRSETTGSTVAEIFASSRLEYPDESFSLDDIQTVLTNGARRGIFNLHCFTDSEFKYSYNRNMVLRNQSNAIYGQRNVQIAGSGCYATQGLPMGARCPSAKGTITSGCCPNGAGYPSSGGTSTQL